MIIRPRGVKVKGITETDRGRASNARKTAFLPPLSKCQGWQRTWKNWCSSVVRIITGGAVVVVNESPIIRLMKG